MTKIKPFRDYMDKLAEQYDVIFNLVGIRADEADRTSYTPCGQYSHKVFTLKPLKDDEYTEQDVFNLVEKSGLGLPQYYSWRTRSGCYFCFFQRRIEWVNLKEQHPDLFEKAKSFEKTDLETGKRYTWIPGMSLEELEEKAPQIKERYRRKLQKKKEKGEDMHLTDASLFEKLMKEEEPDQNGSCGTCR